MLPNWRQPDNFKVAPHQAVIDKLNQQELSLMDGQLQHLLGKLFLEEIRYSAVPTPLKIIKAFGAKGIYHVLVGKWKVTRLAEESTIGEDSLFDFASRGVAAALVLEDLIDRTHTLEADDIVMADAHPFKTDKNNPVYIIRLGGGGGTVPQGENQGDVLQMLTDNALGFGPVQIIPER